MQSSQGMSLIIFIEFVALIVRNRTYNLLKEQMLRMDSRQKYMTVPAAIRELGKIVMVRRNGGSYKLDYAVTRNKKTILRSFGLDETSIRSSADEISKQLAASQSCTVRYQLMARKKSTETFDAEIAKVNRICPNFRTSIINLQTNLRSWKNRNVGLRQTPSWMLTLKVARASM